MNAMYFPVLSVNLTNLQLLTAAYSASGVTNNKSFLKDGTFKYFAQPFTASHIPFPELWDDSIYNNSTQSHTSKGKGSADVNSTQKLSQLISPFSSSAFVEVMLISGSSCCGTWLQWKPSHSRALMGPFCKVVFRIRMLRSFWVKRKKCGRRNASKVIALHNHSVLWTVRVLDSCK